jgi:hypothetical protein
MRTLAALYERIAHTFVQWRTVLAYGVIIAINKGVRSRAKGNPQP